MGKEESLLLRIIKYIVLFMSGGIVFFLGFYSMIRTTTFKEMELPFFINNDNLGFNIVFFIFFVVVMIVFVSLLDRIQWLSPGKIIFIECITLGILCLLWCFFSKSNPAADQKSIIRLAKILIDSEQYDAERTAELIRYIQMFPYQIGIVSCYQIIFKLFGLWYSTEEIQVFNVICYSLSLFFMSQITYKIFKSKKVLLYQAISTILFTPWYFMIPFCYGDMPSLMFSLGGVYFFLLYENTKKRKNVFFMIVFLICSCILKPNGIIFVAAFCCMLVLKTIQKNEMKSFALAIILFLACSMALPTLKLIYNQIYKLDMQEGSPVYGNMVMGLSESFNAGRYTGYVIKVYDRFEPDTVAMKQDALVQIQQRVDFFCNDIPYTINFFKEKIATEYCEPSYESLLNNKYYSGEAEFVSEIYYGNMGKGLLTFQNYFQSSMYILFFIYIVGLFKKNVEANEFLFVIYFLGIFLFQIVWEAQGRYVLPSVIGILPCVAYGCYKLENVIREIKSKR